jgi:hypothetical protein
VKNHSDCKNVAIMEEIIKNVKTSSMFNETEHMIKEMIENMTFLMKILQGLMLKHVYILSILNFPLNMQTAIFPLSVTSLHLLKLNTIS